MQTMPRTARFWKYILPALSAALAVGFAVVPRSAPAPSYHRFTSPAFPDGVRYTLLYPSDLDHVFFYTFSANYHGKYLQDFTASKKESHVPGVALWHNWFKPEAEFVSVNVEKATSKPLKASRSEKQSANRAEIDHTVEVDNPRAREHFRFSHAEDFGTTLFTQHDRVVTDSFRVLLAGEPVPTP